MTPNDVLDKLFKTIKSPNKKSCHLFALQPLALNLIISLFNDPSSMHFSLQPFTIVLKPSGKDVTSIAAFQAIFKIPIIHIAIRVVILALALYRAQFPLAIIPLLRADSQFSLAITVAVVEVPLIDATITKDILTHTKLAAIHELPLKRLVIRLIILFTLPMLQVLRPRTFVLIPVLLVLILTLP